MTRNASQMSKLIDVSQKKIDSEKYWSKSAQKTQLAHLEVFPLDPTFYMKYTKEIQKIQREF